MNHEAGPDITGLSSEREAHVTQEAKPDVVKALTAEVVRKACPEEALAGAWKAEDALGMKGVTVALQMERKTVTACEGLSAKVSFGAQAVEYIVTVTGVDADKMRVKYYSWKTQPPYFHEGEYDANAKTLTQDLSRINGQVSTNSVAEAQKLNFVRAQN